MFHIFSSITGSKDGGSKLSATKVFGIVAGIAVFIILILFVLWRKGCLGPKSASARGTQLTCVDGKMKILV